MCCGQRRSQWQTNQLLRRPPAPPRNMFPESRQQSRSTGTTGFDRYALFGE